MLETLNPREGGFRHQEWTFGFRQPSLKRSFFSASDHGGFLAIAGDAAKSRGHNSPSFAVSQKSEMENRKGTSVPDFSVENHSSIFLFRMNTSAAHTWASENVQDDAQFFGDALVVEWRYARDLAAAMSEDGLVLA